MWRKRMSKKRSLSLGPYLSSDIQRERHDKSVITILLYLLLYCYSPFRRIKALRIKIELIGFIFIILIQKQDLRQIVHERQVLFLFTLDFWVLSGVVSKSPESVNKLTPQKAKAASGYLSSGICS